MKIEEIDVSRIELNTGQIPGLPKNPRIIRKERYEMTKKSIEETPEMLELREIIVCEYMPQRYVAVCGNQKVRACKELGRKTVLCKVLPAETPVSKLREYAMKDNLLHGPCTIYNGGRNVRHFTYIGDVAEALIYAYGCDRQLVNVRNPESNTVREFCEEVAKYRDLKLDYTDALRPLDNFAQSVDEGIYCVPLHYRDIRQGLALTLSE